MNCHAGNAGAGALLAPATPDYHGGSSMSTAPTDKLKAFVKLTAKKRELNESISEINKKLAELEEPLLEHFASEGIQSVKIAGANVYLSNDLQVKTGEGHSSLEVAEALAKAKLKDLTTANWQRLKSWIKERLGDASPEQVAKKLPKSLLAVIEINAVTKLNVRKG